MICMIMAVYFFVAHKSVRAIFLTVQWLPVAFAPLILTQVYNTADRINVSGFFMVIRRKYPDGRPSGPFINFSKWFYNDADGAGGKRKYLIWPAVMALVVFVGLFSRKKRVKQGKVVKSGKIKKEIMPGADSPFYLVEERIKSWGFSRGSPEPLTIFLERVRRAGR